jgi:hypothetical protein
MLLIVSLETTASSALTLAVESDLLVEGNGRRTGDPPGFQTLTPMRCMRILWNFLRDPLVRDGLGLAAGSLVLGLLAAGLVA